MCVAVVCFSLGSTLIRKAAAPGPTVAFWRMVGSTTVWATYLLLTRWYRGTQSVAAVVAGVMPIATLTILPVVAWRGEVTAVTAHGMIFVALLVVVTGTLAQGLIQFAQQTVPVGTIGLLQVAQPALSVTWSVLFLGQVIRPIQIAGMALVMVGLVAIMVHSQRSRATLIAVN